MKVRIDVFRACLCWLVCGSGHGGCEDRAALEKDYEEAGVDNAKGEDAGEE